jgi:MFS family permease
MEDRAYLRPASPRLALAVVALAGLVQWAAVYLARELGTSSMGMSAFGISLVLAPFLAGLVCGWFRLGLLTAFGSTVSTGVWFWLYSKLEAVLRSAPERYPGMGMSDLAFAILITLPGVLVALLGYGLGRVGKFWLSTDDPVSEITRSVRDVPQSLTEQLDNELHRGAMKIVFASVVVSVLVLTLGRWLQVVTTSQAELLAVAVVPFIGCTIAGWHTYGISSVFGVSVSIGVIYWVVGAVDPRLADGAPMLIVVILTIVFLFLITLFGFGVGYAARSVAKSDTAAY